MSATPAKPLRTRRLRQLTEADAPALYALDQRCFPPGIAYGKAEIRHFLRQSDRGFHVAFEFTGEAGAPVLAGFILTLRRRDRGHVITIDVDEKFRRRGIAQALMQAVERYYEAQPTRGMRLEVAEDNHAARAFYASRGYTAVRALPDYYAPGQDALLLQKDWEEETSSQKLEASSQQ